MVWKCSEGPWQTRSDSVYIHANIIYLHSKLFYKINEFRYSSNLNSFINHMQNITKWFSSYISKIAFWATKNYFKGNASFCNWQIYMIGIFTYIFYMYKICYINMAITLSLTRDELRSVEFSGTLTSVGHVNLHHRNIHNICFLILLLFLKISETIGRPRQLCRANKWSKTNQMNESKLLSTVIVLQFTASIDAAAKQNVRLWYRLLEQQETTYAGISTYS